MQREEWIAFLEERIANREQMCEQYGWELKGSDAAVTFVGRSARGIGVRPKCVAENGNGERIYMLTYKQAQKALKVARAATKE